MFPQAANIQDLSDNEVKLTLDKITFDHGFLRPLRSNIDPTRSWRNGVPNYERADLSYFIGRSKVHPKGSLEYIVENAVKEWEMEASHLDIQNWNSIDHDEYSVSVNDWGKLDGHKAAAIGNYNWLMQNVDKKLYDAESETFESSHHLFRNAFSEFPWEVLKVFSGPPDILFSWRHWAHFTGEYKGRKGDGKRYDLYGFGKVRVNENLKIQEIGMFYDPEPFLQALEGQIDAEELHNGKSLLGPGCPFLDNLNRTST